MFILLLLLSVPVLSLGQEPRGAPGLRNLNGTYTIGSFCKCSPYGGGSPVNCSKILPAKALVSNLLGSVSYASFMVTLPDGSVLTGATGQLSPVAINFPSGGCIGAFTAQTSPQGVFLGCSVLLSNTDFLCDVIYYCSSGPCLTNN